ncbi:MAG: hypothetical protein HYY84_12930 [Deltaproteobacteria bacterium]|nr:hypothetical protein [Deltaproteobacteria bacterium]
MSDFIQQQVRRGRYKKANRPSIPWREIEVEYVYGADLADGENGTEPRTFLSIRALSEKHSVSRSLLGYFAKKQNWLKRREKFLKGIGDNAETLVAKGAPRPAARSIADLEKLLDKFVGLFESAVNDDRVPVPSIADVAAAVRLKEAIAETKASKESRRRDLPSLDELQRLYAEARAARNAPPAACGMVAELCAQCRGEIEYVKPASSPIADTGPDELKVPHKSLNSANDGDENPRG